MKIGILGNAGSWYVEDLVRAAGARWHACERIDFHRLASRVQGESTRVASERLDLHEPDAILVRTMPPGSLEQVVYRMDVLQRLEAAGKLVLNPPRAIECAVDKFLTTSRLAAAGLPVPPTHVCEGSEQALEAFHALGGDVVVKPIFGAEGRGILRVTDEDLAVRVFRTLERIDAVLYVQQFIPHAGFDIRLLVLDGEVLGGVRRSNGADFRTNVARRAIAEPHPFTRREEELARCAAAAVHACFAGVDLLYDPRGDAYVIEVNGVPGWRAFQRATGLDVADRVIQYLEKEAHDRPRY